MHLNPFPFPPVFFAEEEGSPLLCGQITSAGHKARDFQVAIAKAFQNCGMWGQANTPNQAPVFASTVIFPVSLCPRPNGCYELGHMESLFPEPKGQDECNGIAERKEKGKSDLLYDASALRNMRQSF